MAQQLQNGRKKIGITLPEDLIGEVKDKADKNGRQLSREVERLLNIALDVEDGREND